jgi:hypothetical protein
VSLTHNFQYMRIVAARHNLVPVADLTAPDFHDIHPLVQQTATSETPRRTRTTPSLDTFQAAGLFRDAPPRLTVPRVARSVPWCLSIEESELAQDWCLDDVSESRLAQLGVYFLELS